MKKLIFLISSGIPYLRHLSIETVKKSVDCKIIAIVNEELKSILPNDFKKYCDQIVFVSTDKTSKFIMPLNYKEAFKVIDHEYKDNKDMLIYTLNESNILLASKFRDKLNLEGMKYKQCLLFRNKLLMKERLSINNIRVPQHCFLDFQKAKEHTSKYFFEIKEKLRLPFIAKPINMAGGIGVIKINSEIDFEKYIAVAELYGDYEAEEYIEGDLYHCDTILHEGKPIWSECCRYNLPLMNIASLKCVGSIALLEKSALRNRIIQFSLKALEALDYQTGISHLELFHTKEDKLIFLEVTARPGGALIMPMYKTTFGLDLPLTDLLLQLKVPVELRHKVSSYAFWLDFPCLEGKVKSFNTPIIKSYSDIHWKIDLGDITKNSQDMIDISGEILVWNKNYSELENDFKSMTEFIPYETTK